MERLCIEPISVIRLTGLAHVGSICIRGRDREWNSLLYLAVKSEASLSSRGLVVHSIDQSYLVSSLPEQLEENDKSQKQ